MDVFNVNKNKPQHKKFLMLKDEVYYYKARQKFESLVDGFYDRDKKFQIEFQTTFHSSFWEVFIHALLKEQGFKIKEKYARPDFIVEFPEKMYIEVVVSNIKDDGNKEDERTISDVFNNLKRFDNDEAFSKFINESIIRNSSAIDTKLKKYRNEYVECDWIDKDVPFIIALSSYNQINYGKESIFSMFALLYGLYFSPEKDEYSIKDSVVKRKSNGDEVDIPLGIFKNEHFSDVSAIIFSPTTTLGKLSALSKSDGHDPAFVMNVRYNHEGNYLIHNVSPDHPESIYDGIYIFHNPLAKNKIKNHGVFDNKIIQFNLDENDYSHVFQENTLNLPIMARFCHPEILLTENDKLALNMDAAASYNRVELSEVVNVPSSKSGAIGSNINVKKKGVKKKRKKLTRKETKNRMNNKLKNKKK
ncbi:hypothetical protein [Pectobacterium parmentieri]|uniref:hypothetical protein n=1 Tax=Pectobacterium parmentieri TaxID=1905730 RepID=UPI0018DFE732|nr:hypothetical protein [Pectobacterium parmentieri]MBI0552748.1 hypothetical protein [Pectobacterium parmentieri]MBI0561771.1 hypothetical protein [Pectobacterium parmentieri]MBI0566049.1 hypothetical protein [Pectobacterium parmentieri]